MPNVRSTACNIGGPEVRRRKRAAIFSAVATILVAIILQVLDVTKMWRPLIFFPLLMTAIGWFQTKRRFCLAYGLAGVFNLGDLGDVQKIMDPSVRRQDRIQAIKTIGEALLISSAGTFIFLFL